MYKTAVQCNDHPHWRRFRFAQSGSDKKVRAYLADGRPYSDKVPR